MGAGTDQFRRGGSNLPGLQPRPDGGTTGNAGDSGALDRLRRRALEGSGASGFNRGSPTGQMPSGSSGSVSGPSNTRNDFVPPTGSSRPSLSDIRRRMQQDTPGTLPGISNQEKRRTDAVRDLPKAEQLPALVGPGRNDAAPSTRQGRLNDMQGRIMQDLNTRTKKGSASFKPGDAPHGPSLKPGDTPLGKAGHGDLERNKLGGPGKDLGGPGRKMPDLDRSKLGGPDGRGRDLHSRDIHDRDGRGRDGHGGPGQHADVRFADRYKQGQFRDVTKGEFARGVKLDDQFRMRAQGDVARRMALEKHMGHGPHGPHAPHIDVVVSKRYTALGLQVYGYHGPIDPYYTHHCFKHHYYGPAFFPSHCWYPKWGVWVDWSWHYRCHPYWDPRPIWCQPVYYTPCVAWVYYPVPVWTPLPTVACGTWVDVPTLTTASPCDLQLLAVRFVDPGHPQENLGPRYRVWFRNNSTRPVVQPFNVVLLASNDANAAAGLPEAGVRVTAIEAGDTQSVDIRLPLAATTMTRDVQGNPAPFNFLHVLVDAQRETNDALPENNGARLSRTEILPVDPSTFDVQPQVAVAGTEVTLAGEGFGPGPGRVVVFAGGREIDAEVWGWYDLGVRITLPRNLPAGPAEVVVVRADGAAANPARITVGQGQ
jgi:hypothetical protein